MRILLVSETGYSLGFAPALLSEGHSVDFCMGTTPLVYSGMPDIAIMDTKTTIAENLRSQGVKVFGVSSWSNVLNTNIDYKNNLINAIGYKSPNEQQRAGVRIVVVSWFNGQHFISKSLVFNYDRFMSGNIGTKVTSSGYIAYFNVDGWKIINDVLTPLEKFLRKANHRGCFSINVLVCDKEFFVEDISPSITLPYTQAIFENTWRHKSDIILDIFDETSKAIPYVDKVVCGVLVSVAPYPHKTPSSVFDVVGLNMQNAKHMWLMDIVNNKNTWTSGHINGCLGYVLARGVTFWEAKKRVYRTINNISVDGIQYRDDIGKNINERLQQLEKDGWIKC